MSIDSELQFDELTLVKYLESIKSPFLPQIHEVYGKIKDILNNRIQHIFPNYTLHNTDHSFRIIEYMSRLVDDYKKLNELEITLLIYSALLHDIGMAVSQTDVDSIKNDCFSFCEVKFSTMKQLWNNDETLALQDYVRRIHAFLSGKYITEHLKAFLIIPNMTTLDFAKDLSLICESHTENYDWLRSKLSVHQIKGDYSYNPQFIATILRLADILDIDAKRTPYNLYKLISPKDVSDIEWKQHFVISNSNKIVINEKTKQKKIVFHGTSNNANIHRKILAYISTVKNELTNAVTLVNGMPLEYNLLYDTNPEINIQAEGYTFSDYKMTLEFRAISLLLMGEKIYGNKALGLREVIQNSIDSCKIFQELENNNHEFGNDTYQPTIKIILDPEKNQVIIKDNGTGMSIDIIKKHFLNIGVSYYNSSDFLLKNFAYKPIGNFGIGFLSCFMLSDNVKVITRHYKARNKYIIELERGNEFTSITELEDVIFKGTEIILDYTSFMEVFDNEFGNIYKFLKEYFLTDKINFQLIDKSNERVEVIHNPIELAAPLERNTIKINFSDYLKNIEGYAIIKSKKSYIKNFEEIDFKGVLYRFSEENGFLEVTDFSNLDIDDYIGNNMIKYLSVPLIKKDKEEDFLNGMKFTGDDLYEVIEKMDRELDWISIIFHKKHQEHLYDEAIDDSYSIFNKLSIEELSVLGHSKRCHTRAYVKSITLFEGKKNDLYLPFDLTDNEYKHWSYRKNKRKDLFMRSVLIKNFVFNIPALASIFEINTLVVNINSRKFIPDISRNDIDDKTKKIINYIIGKAIHSGAHKLLDLQLDEKAVLQNFIDIFYNTKTEYEL
jgi:molecular chaperone HtpG